MERTYTYDDVRRASLEYFNGDELAAEVFAGKYALRDSGSKLYELTPTDMHRRLAREFARVEAKYPNPMGEDEIFGLLSSWQVVPQGSPMAAIGNPFQLQSLSNCFVIDSPCDSYGGILKADQEQAQIMKRRGGVGFDLSLIRPKGQQTSNAALTTDGIGVFMERFSNTCREVAQGGRRGALMLTLSVHHPQIRTFINIKRDRKKVTGANISIRLTDEFMEAVRDGKPVQLRFPVEADVEHSIEETVDARTLWNEIIEAAHESAEPGLLFWDTVLKMTPTSPYPDFKSISTNPCLTGDTRVAVADGRGYVSFKQLADEGRDVPVYTHQDDTGKMIVRLMRNPRLTGKDVPVFKVTIEGGHSFKATGNHEMIMHGGERKRVDELVTGDQLMISKRVERTLVELDPHTRSNNPSHYVVIENSSGSRSEHRMIWKHHNGPIPRGHVIHHVNFNSKDNRLENLQLMGYAEHHELHAARMRGGNNPIFKIKADPVRFAAYLETLSDSLSGNNNPRAYDVSNEQLYEHLISLTKTLGRRMSGSEWVAYARQHSLPAFMNDWRLGGRAFYELTCSIATELGFEHVELDTCLQRSMINAREQGYVTEIVDNEVYVKRTCEWCKLSFMKHWDRREIAFCSGSCSLTYANRKAGKNETRKASVRAMFARKAELSRKAILDAYTNLRFELGRVPLQDELRVVCKERGISFRTGTKNGFRNFADIKRHAELHNHRVVSVESCGCEDVYNGTVDEEHSFCFGGWDMGNNEQLQVHSQNCGEIVLSASDACRLMLVNLCKFVTDPFTPQAKFDFKAFGDVVKKAQRLMDDLVDLELEVVDKIIEKITADPEPADVKRTELELWERIRKTGAHGRRTGLGITGLGDTLAYLNVRYGSDASVAKTEEVYRHLALNAWRSSVTLAEERGAFPAFDHVLEKDHPFIDRIMAEDADLKRAHKKHGRRNIALTTTAPAGSVSILTQTTSGCEPAFLLSYKRRRKITASDKEARVDFVDAMGDRWQEYVVYHPGFKRWMETTGQTDPEQSPYWKATSNDTDWVKKIDVQAAAQRWICHAISCTTNVPADTPVDTIKQIYVRGWETGCKGVTVYRDGCRSGVLVKADDPTTKKSDSIQPASIAEVHAPKRPQSLDCDIHRVTVRGDAYLVLVGLHEGKPYEVFAGLSEHVEVPKKTKRGNLIKNGKKDGLATYNLRIPLHDDDELLFKDIVTMFDSPLYGAFTRTISLSLRHGIPVKFLCEQLKKDRHSDMTSFSSVIARVLGKNYIPDGTRPTDEKLCPTCASDQLSYQSGCVSCVSCGWSRCS